MRAAVYSKVFFEEGVERNGDQQNQGDRAHQGGGGLGGDVGTTEGANKGEQGGGGHTTPVHGHPLEVAGGGQGSARGRGQFIGAQEGGDGGFGEENQEGRELNQAATADNGIDQACAKGGKAGQGEGKGQRGSKIRLS